MRRAAAGGRGLIYRVNGSDVLKTVESPQDGKDVPVLVAGKPRGETMGIRDRRPARRQTERDMGAKAGIRGTR